MSARPLIIIGLDNFYDVPAEIAVIAFEVVNQEDARADKIAEWAIRARSRENSG